MIFFSLAFDRDIMREMGDLGLLGATIDGKSPTTLVVILRINQHISLFIYLRIFVQDTGHM